jgi:hypothetical protein
MASGQKSVELLENMPGRSHVQGNSLRGRPFGARCSALSHPRRRPKEPKLALIRLKSVVLWVVPIHHVRFLTVWSELSQ